MVGANIVKNPSKCYLLKTLQGKAKVYAQEHNAHYLNLGCPEALDEIANAAKRVADKYGPFDEIWSCAGSGVLTRGIQKGILEGKVYAVRTGRKVKEIGRAIPIDYEMDFHKQLEWEGHFDSCPNIDRKAWQVCYNRTRRRVKNGKKILFWNVIGTSPTRFSP